jgi:Orsellinic acid/F9775 biosynthesis cluster protein D
MRYSADHSEKALRRALKRHSESTPESTRKMPTTASTPVLDPALFPGLIQYHPEYRLLYCRSYTTVVFLKGLFRHLQDVHKVSAATRQPLLDHCQSLDLITQPKDLQLPPDYSLALQFLPVQEGYSCRQCRFLTCSEKFVHVHINRAYKLTWEACSDNYQPVQLQGWLPSTQVQYWIVRSQATAIPQRPSVEMTCHPCILLLLYITTLSLPLIHRR